VTSRLRIEDTTKCSRTALGFGFGSDMGFAAARERVTPHANPNPLTSAHKS